MKILALLLLLFVGCSTSKNKVRVENLTQSRKSDVQLTLTPFKNGEWLASYDFKKSAQIYSFARTRNKFRKDLWKTKTPGVEIVANKNGVEFLSSANKQNNIKVLIKTYRRNMNQDYEVSTRFTNNAWGFFPGFALLKEVKGNWRRLPGMSPNDRTELVHKIRVMASKKKPVIYRGEKRTAPFFLNAIPYNGGGGTYLYTGDLEVKEMNGMRVVLDPGLPTWIRKKMTRDYSRFLSVLEKYFGYRPKIKTLMSINWDKDLSARDPKEKNAYMAAGGGMLGAYDASEIQVTLWGKAWAKPTKEAQNKFFHVTFHETLHYWDEGGSRDFYKVAWFNEGGADAFSFRAALHAGVIGKGTYKEEHNVALNHCIKGYKAGMVLNKLKGRDFRLNYSCGMMMILVIESIVSDGLAVRPWREFYKKFGKRDQTYTEEDFVRVLRAEVKDMNLLNRLLAWKNGHSKEPKTELMTLLELSKNKIGQSKKGYLFTDIQYPKAP